MTKKTDKNDETLEEPEDISARIIFQAGDLDEDVQQKTGFKRAVFQTTNYPNPQNLPCQYCPENALIFKQKVYRAIDKDGKEISLSMLDPEISSILRNITRELHICYGHIFKYLF